MRAYLLGVICAAFLISLLQTLGGEWIQKRKLIGGIFLALVVFRPLGGLELPELSPESYRRDAEETASDGILQADAARREFITDECEAYILSKAAALGLEPEIRVELDAEGLPCAVTLTGGASPAEREELSGCIVRELGLGKEDVTWIDPYQSSE